MTVKTKRRTLCQFFGLAAWLVSSCAVQQTPTGGEKDTEPPELVSVTPPNETLNFSAEEIEIVFNEYVQLQNAFQEITISPDPESRPEFRTKKNAIIVRFTDSLEENTTYQINFGKAIGDMNERNPFPNLKYVFSTGNQIDSLRIRGSVGTYTMNVDPKSNDPSSILVLIHREQDSIAHPDSLIMMKKPGYYTYADSSGNFEITNLREGSYRLYALKEENDSRLYDDKEELIGFLDEPLTLMSDTLLGKIHLALMEQEQLEVLNDRNQDARLTLLLNKRTDSLRFDVLFPETFKNKILVEDDDATDSVTVWLPSFQYDSLKLAVGENNRYIDTILFRNFTKKEKLNPFTITDDIQQGMLRPGDKPVLTFSRPIDLNAADHFELQEDSVKVPPGEITLKRLSIRKYEVDYNWKQRAKYQLTIGADYLHDQYGAGNKAYQRQFIADSLENYGDITITYSIPDSIPDSVARATQYLVQLLNDKNTLVKADTIDASREIRYPTLRPGKYLIRVIFDRNRNGRWDGTNLFGRIQPEKILLFDPGENLRANWDQEYTIEIPIGDPKLPDQIPDSTEIDEMVPLPADTSKTPEDRETQQPDPNERSVPKEQPADQPDPR